MKRCTKLDVALKLCPIAFQGHPSNFEAERDKNRRFLPELGISGLQLQFEFTDGYEMMQ